MKKIFLPVISLMLILSLVSCAKDSDVTESDTDGEITYEESNVTDEDIKAIRSFFSEREYDIVFETYVSVVTDGDEKNVSGSASSFKLRKKEKDGKSRYYGTYTSQNSYLPFAITYDYYWNDGVMYTVYNDPDTTDELDINEYNKEDMTEKNFIISFDSFEFPCPNDEEFSGASASLSSTGVKTVSLTADGTDTARAIIGGTDVYTDTAGATEESIVVSATALSFAVKDGALTGIIASYDIDYESAEGSDVHVEYDKSWTINAVGGDVEDFELPDPSKFEVSE